MVSGASSGWVFVYVYGRWERGGTLPLVLKSLSASMFNQYQL